MSKMTKTGQVTLPAGVRRAMGLKPGDKVQFAALTDRKALMQRMLRPISHERAQELVEERTRHETHGPGDVDEEGSP